MTETIKHIKESLKGIYPSSEINGLVRLIMERVCNLQPHHFLLCRDKVLPESEKRWFYEIVERLKRLEPIQYILGIADFYSLEFEVSPSVLIPRPETEELVDLVILENQKKEINLLDIGTGSGCIAITLQKHLRNANVFGIDISAKALEVARRNAKRHKVATSFIQADILQLEQAEAALPYPFDVIVSNPPYIREEEMKEMEPNVVEHEPHLALFVPNEDPLLFYRHIAAFGRNKLKEKGQLYFEINSALGEMTVNMLCQAGYKDVKLIKDLSGKDRIIKARK